MKPKRSFLNFIVASLLALGLLAGSSLHAQAARAVPKYPTFVIFNTLPGVALGKQFTLSGHLLANTGVPITFLDIFFTLNGTKVGEVRTDAAGFFQHRFNNKLPAGTYTIMATTRTNHYYIGATGSISLEVLPADVHVQTVPPIPGIAFSMNGQQFTSGADGVADVKIGTPGKYQLTVMTDQYHNPDQRITFARWLDDVYEPSEMVRVPSDKVLQVGLNVYQKVGETFVDMSGFPVNPQRVKQFTIRSAQGDLFTFTDGQPAWIPATRVARFQNGLVVTNLQYSVIDMQVDGSNVVNKSQQRFFVHPNETWQISLILYSLTIHPNDGLFGSAVGKSVELVYPDGHIQNFQLDKNGSVAIHGLARGNYTVEVLDAKGLKQVIPVSLSRSQTIDINVPTHLDLMVVIGLGLLVAISLIVFGRLQPLRSRTASKRPALPSPQNAQVRTDKLQTVEENASQPEHGIIKWS
jgi:hypothetical protein